MTRPRGSVATGAGKASRRPPAVKLARGLIAAAAAVGVFTAIKLLFRQTMGDASPFLLYPIAVVVVAWIGGVVPGLIATAAAAVLSHFLFFDAPLAAPTSIEQQRELARLVLFVVEGAAIAVITGRLHQERLRAWLAAAEARTSAAKLDAVLTAVDDGITVQDRDGRLVYANQAAARLTAFDGPADFLGASAAEVSARFELLTEDGAPFPLAELPGRKALGGEGSSAERLIRFRRRGSADDHYSMVRANPIVDADGEVVGAVNIFRDITDQRRHQAALRLGQQWLSTALRSIGDAVITTDRDGKVTFLNPVAEQLTGWPQAEGEGRPLAEVFVSVAEDTRGPIESPAERVLRGGKVIGHADHTLLITRGGREVAIDDSAAPIRDDGGDLVGVVLVFRDVSAARLEEHRRAFLAGALQELSSSLDYERTLVTVARLAVPTIADWCAVDMRDGDSTRTRRLAVAHVDPEKLALVAELEKRYPPDPDAPQGVPNILRTGMAEMVAEIPAALIEASARDAAHLRVLRELALHSYIGVPIKVGDRTVGAITFVSAESRRAYGAEDLRLAQALADRAAVAIANARLYRDAEQAREDAASDRDQLAALIVAAPVGIAVLRAPELVFEMFNEPYRGMVPGIAIGRAASELVVDPRNLDRLRQVVATGEAYGASEYKVVRPGPDGPVISYNTFTVQPLRAADGTVDRLVFFATDVTDQVVARQRVDVARADAERANRSKDEFLAMLGHELRNPLAPILTALQLMSLRGGDRLEHERKVIERQVKHMVRLVDDLLDVSRITRGKVNLEREPVEIASVIADAIEIASPLLEQGRHQFETQVPRHGLVVLADRQRLTQVMSNLLTNAAKYTEAGGRIEVVAERAGDRITVRVKDSGIGIAADMLPRIFDLFVQEEQTIERARGGLGLGLTIVKNLVAMHDGTVTAHSAGLGHGSEFVVELPAAGPQSIATPLSVPAVVPPTVGDGQGRVLIVDDNEDAADLLSMVLEAHGFTTRVAHDGPSALEIAQEFRPQTALLDIGLPVMDGFELARRLRADRDHAGLRLIALTGYGQDTDRQRSKEAGFDHHLVKPIDVKTVVELLQAD